MNRPSNTSGVARQARGRPRLALEITLALAVKFAAMIVIWHVWFSHPEGRQLNGERIGAMIYGTPPSAPRKD